MKILEVQETNVGFAALIILRELAPEIDGGLIFPDHSTWARFRNMGKQLIRQYFVRYEDYMLVCVEFKEFNNQTLYKLVFVNPDAIPGTI